VAGKTDGDQRPAVVDTVDSAVAVAVADTVSLLIGIDVEDASESSEFCRAEFFPFNSPANLKTELFSNKTNKWDTAFFNPSISCYHI